MNKFILLNCPFCGGEAQLKNMKKVTFYVECKTCKATTSMFIVESDAIKAWNRRYIERG